MGSRLGVPVAFALVLAFALAGCLGGGPSTKATVSDAGSDRPTDSEVTFDASTATNATAFGDLEVKVTDQLGTPFPGATVTVTPSTPESKLDVPPALTDAKGVSLFKGLPAEGYKVSASADGFETATQGATVVAGQVAKIEMELKGIIADSSYNVTVEFDGRVTCSAGTAVLVTCAVVKDQAKQAGKEHIPGGSFGFGRAASPPVDDRIFEVWVEISWTEAVDLPALSGKVILFEPSNSDKNQVSSIGDGSRDPPLRVVAPVQLLEGWGLGAGGNVSFELRPQTTYATPNAAIDWTFHAWATTFYNAPANECWSPAKAARVAGCTPSA